LIFPQSVERRLAELGLAKWQPTPLKKKSEKIVSLTGIFNKSRPTFNSFRTGFEPKGRNHTPSHKVFDNLKPSKVCPSRALGQTLPAMPEKPDNRRTFQGPAR
jgi:hypothetical protein